MKRMLSVVFVAVLSASCTTTSPRHADSIVGVWRSDEILSQLGPSVIQYTFGADGSVHMRQTFTHGQIGPLEADGRFRATSDEIIFLGDEKTHRATYSFEGDTLVIDEGEVFRLRRVE